MPTFEAFVQSPLYTSNFLNGDLQEVNPSRALIETKVGDTLSFRFKAKTSIHEVYFYSKRDKASFRTFAKLNDEWYIASYPVTASGMYNLEIVINNENISSLIYKLKAASK